jgi:uncharacterized protein (UPF0335 family)
MNNKNKDRKDCLKEIIHKIEFVQNSIGDLQKKIKDVIIYLEKESVVEGSDPATPTTPDKKEIKRDL